MAKGTRQPGRWAYLATVALWACSEGASPDTPPVAMTPPMAAGQQPANQGAGQPAPAPMAQDPAPVPMQPPPSPSDGMDNPNSPPDNVPPMDGAMDAPPAANMDPTQDPAPTPAGPMEGDPNKPMVAIDTIPCGAPRVGFTSSPPTVQIGGREVVIAYPCAHEDAPVTFFLFLHGTLQDAQKVPFTMNAFPIHEYVDSHNVIVAVPKAVGTQWGNGDNGQDLPHLYEVVDWVYDNFGDKFDIRSMWASGGSWGAFYLSRTFACDPRFEDRLRGVRMVVGTPCPACSDRLACIVAEQELEEGGGMPLSAMEQEMKSSSNIDGFATAHGCDPKMKMPDLGPVRHWTWPNCDPGFVHSYYLGPGNHPDPWNDPTSMDYMVDEIKSIE